MKKIVLLLPVFTAVSLLGGSFSWQERVEVVKRRPIYRNITIRTPYQECRIERVKVINNVRQNNANEPVSAALGAAAGGILGNTIGRKDGKSIATIGGAVLGAFVGTNMAKNANSQQQPRVSYHKERICDTHYNEKVQRQLVHYRNIAWYRGHKIVKNSQRPLQWINLRVTVSY